MPRAAMKRVHSFVYPDSPPEFDPWVGVCEERRGRQRCILLDGQHVNGHKFVSSSYYTWWKAHGHVPKNWMLRPKNGDWRDTERLDNLELVPRKQHWQELHAKPHRRTGRGWVQVDGVWCKDCVSCGERKPVEQFPPKRNRCQGCWTDVNRARAAKSYDGHKAQGCVVVNGHHFHIGQLGHKKTPEQREATRVLGFVRYLLEPTGRRQAPTPHRPRLEATQSYQATLGPRAG